MADKRIRYAVIKIEVSLEYLTGHLSLIHI